MAETIKDPSYTHGSIISKLIAIIEDMTRDWDLENQESINQETQLIADLAFESIDIVQLVVAIEENFSRRGLPFEKILMTEGRYVDDLSIGELSDFLHQHLSNTSPIRVG